MPNQDEQECLNSERFNFKDPDVLFVANLGSRGLPPAVDSYWVRYKAKNSYGAYVQGNMYCKKDPTTKKFVRHQFEELIQLVNVETYLLNRVTSDLGACNRKGGCEPSVMARIDEDERSIKRNAEDVVLTSASDLSKLNK